MAAPGDGLIHARLLPPSRLVLPHLEFAYPLKLISTSPPTAPCLTVFMLSYGGGLVSADRIRLSVVCEAGAKLCLLTQGSTKLYKRRSPDHITSQHLTATLHPGSALLLLPDPLQPFADSHYTQRQALHIPSDNSASFVVLDWLSEGRSARGEHWALHRLESRNEVFSGDHRKLLLLRDAVVLDGGALVGGETLRARMDAFACMATVIVCGPLFGGLVRYVLARYLREPRVGARGFGGAAERRWDVLWTAASVRGFLVVKVSGEELQEVRGFLRELLEEGKGGGGGRGGGEAGGGEGGGGEGGGESAPPDTHGEHTKHGDIVREFGEDSLRCLW